MKSKLRPGLVSITFRGLSIEEIIILACETGLHGIEWGGDVHVPHGDLQRAKQVGQQTREAGLEVSAYGSYYRFDDCLEFDGGDYLPFDTILETAYLLGAPVVRVWAGREGVHASTQNGVSKIADRTREMADRAAKLGIRVGFEFHENSLTESNASTRNLLNEIDHPNVFTFWQPYLSVEHAYRLDGLEDLVGQIENVHCNHFAKEGWPHALLLEEGEAQWKDFLSVLRRDGRERWVSLEHVKDDSVENFRRDAATLVNWISGLS
ncbi:sugar phosphate isomerase/epimerase [Puniceicoccaceae bacterium K14]|nr:sugar phosphate isomerase/epimerase [Puniceicoccaceae bacterium K14]